jgi:hypothetical protein
VEVEVEVEVQEAEVEIQVQVLVLFRATSASFVRRGAGVENDVQICG